MLESKPPSAEQRQAGVSYHKNGLMPRQGSEIELDETGLSTLSEKPQKSSGDLGALAVLFSPCGNHVGIQTGTFL